MNYVSAQLMRARDRGVHASYLHRLYAEGLEELQKKRRQVCTDALKPLKRCRSSQASAAPCMGTLRFLYPADLELLQREGFQSSIKDTH